MGSRCCLDVRWSGTCILLFSVGCRGVFLADITERGVNVSLTCTHTVRPNTCLTWANFVAIAAIGVLLPGIPTVGPLLLASLFLLKSSPSLERRLIRNRFFAKYLPYLDGSSEMSFKARLTSIGLMWASICLSCLMLKYVGNSPGWMVGLVILAGMVGTVFILRFGKSKTPARTPA